MKPILALMISIVITDFASAQWIENVPGAKPGEKVQVESKTPPALDGKAKLTFKSLDVCFDCGSHAAFFTRENGTELVLFFPHPGYWTQTAKSSSKQPVAIQGSSFIEISPDSKLQTRLLELLANDIVDGKHDRDTTLTIIRIRDCLLHRAPLAEIVERYDPKTWERRDEDGFK